MRSALLIGNSRYDDPALASLGTPAADTRSLAEVLRDPQIGGFDEVTPLINANAGAVRRAISTFLSSKKLGDLALLYFSGHGVLDENGILFLAAQDSEQKFLNATAIPAQSFVIYELDRCRSRSKILILDCCFAGAFARGTRGIKGAEIPLTRATFESTGSGLVVLTASTSTQFASEGGVGSAGVGLEAPPLSVFTQYLVEGLQTGNADLDNNGTISLDELYAYTHNQVVQQYQSQTPCKYVYDQQGEMVIARSERAKPPEMVDLPPELHQAMRSSLTGIRAGAVKELADLLNSPDGNLAFSARQALEELMHDREKSIAEQAQAAVRSYLFKEPTSLVSRSAIPTGNAPAEGKKPASPPPVGQGSQADRPAYWTEVIYPQDSPPAPTSPKVGRVTRESFWTETIHPQDKTPPASAPRADGAPGQSSRAKAAPKAQPAPRQAPNAESAPSHSPRSQTASTSSAAKKPAHDISSGQINKERKISFWTLWAVTNALSLIAFFCMLGGLDNPSPNNCLGANCGVEGMSILFGTIGVAIAYLQWHMVKQVVDRAGRWGMAVLAYTILVVLATYSLGINGMPVILTGLVYAYPILILAGGPVLIWRARKKKTG